MWTGGGNEKDRPLVYLKNWQTVDGLFIILSAWEFESCLSPENAKSGWFASPMRYFYFTAPKFWNARKLFFYFCVSADLVQKSRTEVRDFWLHLVCQRDLVEISGIEPLTSWMPFKRSPSWAIPPYELFAELFRTKLLIFDAILRKVLTNPAVSDIKQRLDFALLLGVVSLVACAPSWAIPPYSIPQ